MRQTLRVLGLTLALALAVARTAAATGTCSVPLILTQGTGTANVLFCIDNSMSMDEAMQDPAYNPATTYPGNFSANSSFNVSTAGNYTPYSFNSKYPKTPSAYMAPSDCGHSSVYYGNYLNWVFFTATAAQRAAIPAVTRTQAIKSAVTTIIAGASNVNFGLMTFNSSSTGGHLVSPIGTAAATIQSDVSKLCMTTSTPLARMLDSALVYYQTTGAKAPIQAACQSSFIILATDGLPNNDTPLPAFLVNYLNDDPGCGTKGHPACPDWVDDVAGYMYRNDLRPDIAGVNNVSTFVVGCNVDAGILQATANAGGGNYYSVTSVQGIETALTSAFNVIVKRIAAGASVAVVSAENRTNNRLYRARYESQTWRGFVEAYALPYNSGDSSLWEAGALLAARTPSGRTINTSINGTTMTAFTLGNASTLQTSLGAADLPTAQSIIHYTMGDSVAGTRSRNGWPLGDIVDAAPLVVSAPSSYSLLPGYTAFRTANLNRQEVVYVGSNDGMLHCFSTANGVEQWAYVPRDILPKLSDLMSVSYCHEYMVNLSPAAYDIKFGTTWKTVLLGGEERGGNGLFALDVTNPAANSVNLLWDIDLPALQGSWNTPTLVRDRVTGNQEFVVGTGYNSASSTASLLVLDPATGNTLHTYSLGAAVLGNKTTRATGLDLNFDGYDDLLYLGDLTGRIWRVDMRTNPWTITTLFSCGQPIQAAPTVTVNSLGQPMVLFGTGQYINVTDVTSSTTQSIYGVIDDGTGATYTPSNLADQTTSLHALTGAQKGWMINLVNGTGERVIRTGAIINSTYYVPSFVPNDIVCQGGGLSYMYAINYRDGGTPPHLGGLSSTITGRSSSMGDGLLADPTVDLVNGNLIMQSSNAVLLSQTIIGGLQQTVVKSWRQKWN